VDQAQGSQVGFQCIGGSDAAQGGTGAGERSPAAAVDRTAAASEATGIDVVRPGADGATSQQVTKVERGTDGRAA